MPEFEYTKASPVEQPTDLLVLPFFRGPEAGPGVKELGRLIGEDVVGLLERNGLRGKMGDALTVPTLGRLPAASLLLVGLGPRPEVTADTVRRASGRVAKVACRYEHVATTLAQASRGPWEDALEALVQGVLLGSYRFDRYKAKSASNENGRSRLGTIRVHGTTRWDPRKARRAIARAEVLAEATAWTRDLVNTPAMDATPAFLADQARAMAKEVGLVSKVWTKADLEKGGFGGILGVGAGSVHTPRLIELTYGAGGGAPLALTGKGITFDSGGLSLKPAKGMEWMKSDMSGAAAVLGTMRALAGLGVKANVVAAVPSSENMPGGSAIRPGDVLRHRGGKTSEVVNTDAEGRLVLADALAYLAEKEPRVIVDVATLTGACVIALGQELWGVMGNDAGLIRDLLAAGERAGEPGWELPLWGRYRKQIDSPIADVKNQGGRWGSAITAGLFLKEFVGDIPWAHMDVAGTAYAERPGDYWTAGGTGSPVRTLVGFVERRAAGRRARR